MVEKDGLPIDKETVNKMIEKFESRNGARIKDFSVKEIVLLLHKDQKKEISKINTKLDKHIDWSTKNNISVHKMMADHDKVMSHIVDTLPEKGFCEKVTIALFPEDDLSLSKKTETLWHDRRWIKYLAGGVVMAVLVGIGNIAVQVMFYG